LQEEIAAKLFKGCWSLVTDLKISGLAVIWLVSGWYLAGIWLADFSEV
jgi:hypothetical protein